MKDEEMARLFIINKYDLRKDLSIYAIEDNYELGREYYAFLAGLKAGRPQWHTDPNDLPPMIQDERHISERVWISVENWGTEDGHYDYNKNCWIIRCRIVNLPILGWCEIPTFDKE